MKVKNLAILLLFCFTVVTMIFPRSAFSQGKNLEVLEALQDLRGKMGADWRVIYHDDQNRVKTLRGELSLPYSGTPEEAAGQFLKENAAVFQIDPEIRNVQVESVKESLTGYHVWFKQTFGSLPVFNGGIEVHLRKDKSVFLVHNYYLPDIDTSTLPFLLEKESIEIAKNDFLQIYRFRKDKGEELRSYEDKELIFKEEPKPQLGVFEYQGKPHLVYKVLLNLESPFALVEYVVDANRGAVLERRSLIQNADGTGKVFDPNPVNTLNNTSLQDNNDADDPVFDNAYFIKTLKDLTLSSGSYSLYGPYVDVNDLVEFPYYYLFTLGYIHSDSGIFDFKRKVNQFEHVMLYYYIDTNQRYIQSLGFTDVNNRRIQADPHGLFLQTLLGEPNAHYAPSPIGAGYLAFGESGVDAAEDADVILHEYGHAIQDNQTAGKYLNSSGCDLGTCSNCDFPETVAMGEGFGDYWAASNTYDISITNGFDPACLDEWFDVSRSDNDGDPICLRKVNSAKHYPEGMVGECHADGEIWSAALWELFNILDKTITDTLVLESHFLVPANPTFSDGAVALLNADQLVNSGAFQHEICDVMMNRGINVPAERCPYEISSISVTPAEPLTALFAIVALAGVMAVSLVKIHPNSRH